MYCIGQKASWTVEKAIPEEQFPLVLWLRIGIINIQAFLLFFSVALPWIRTAFTPQYVYCYRRWVHAHCSRALKKWEGGQVQIITHPLHTSAWLKGVEDGIQKREEKATDKRRSELWIVKSFMRSKHWNQLHAARYTFIRAYTTQGQSNVGGAWTGSILSRRLGEKWLS